MGLALSAACSRPSPAAHSMPTRVAVEVSGCSSISSDGVCSVRADGTVRVFVASTSAASFGGDDGGISAELLATLEDGRLYELAIPREAQRVHVATQISEGGRLVAADANLVLKTDEPPPWLTEARSRVDRGDQEAALTMYRDHLGASDDGEAALAGGQAARVELARGHVDESAALFRGAIAKDRAAGRLSDAVDDSLALAFALGQRSHRLTEARAVLEGVTDLLDRYPDGRARDPYYASQLLSETGNRRGALQRLREAERRATRLGLTRLVGLVRSSMATELDLLGRFDDALEIRRAEERDLGSDPCDRLVLRSGMGYGLLMIAARAGVDPSLVGNAEDVLRKASAETACADNYLHAATLGNLALAALLGGRPDEAAARLAAARARASELPLGESFAWLEIEARIALARKDAARALRAYQEMEVRARAVLLVDYEWVALAGCGAALEKLGRKREALAAYAQAEARLDDASLAIPVGEGRARFLVERERSVTAGIELLLGSARSDEAFRWARRARRRVLSGVEATRRLERLDETGRARWGAAIDRYARERAAIDEDAAGDWKLPVADLGPAQERRRAREVALRSALEELLSVLAEEGDAAPPVPLPPAGGELILLFHPTPEGFIGFAADARATFVFHVAPLERGAGPDELARRLLVPASLQIERSASVRLLLPGGLAHVDMHALPYGDGPLLARMPVEYGLDLAPSSERRTGRQHALVVGDPQRDLPEAKREADGVADSLAGGGAVDVELLEAGRATHTAVVDGLEVASLFHFAGHATYEGEDGWDSMLPLADGGHLIVSDVLALHHAPERVMLSGCSAAHTSSVSPGDTLGIAQAFLAAGSEVVVAPTRDVADALSARFAANLYEALRGDGSADVAKAARAAQLRLRESDPDGDWASFRVLRR